MESIYSQDPRVYIISSHIVLLYNNLHTLSFSSFDPTYLFRDFVDPQSQIVSNHLTLSLLFSNQNCSCGQIHFGMP